MIQKTNQLLRHISPWLFYVILPLPGVVMFVQGLTGGLGADPIEDLIEGLGEFGLQLLIVGLAITPLLRIAGLNLMRFRRALGVVAFGYVLAHFLVWLLLDIGIWAQIISDLTTKPYLMVGLASLVLLLPLAVTSNNWSVRKLGRGWRVLHRLVYAAAILGGVHNMLQEKTFDGEAAIYLAVILILLALRVPMVVRLFKRG